MSFEKERRGCPIFTFIIMNKNILTLALVSFISTPCLAGDWSDPISTDRPDFTESAFVVPEGMTQVETGFTYQRLQDENFTTAPETLIRHAVVNNFELRLGTPSWNITRRQGHTTSNFNDVYAGFKLGLEKSVSKYFDLSLIPATFIPAGNDGQETWSPEIKICTASELDDTFSLSTMSYFRSEAVDADRETIYQQTFSVGVGFTDRIASFYEYIFETYNDGPFSQITHIGFTYLLTPDMQADIHMGRNVSGGYADPFFAGGLSFRF